MEKYPFSLNPAKTKLKLSIREAKLDASSVPAFKQAIDRCWVDSIREVVIDFSEVEFIDSSGIGALLGIQKRLHSDSMPVVIAGAKPNIVSVIELLRLHRVFSLQ